MNKENYFLLGTMLFSLAAMNQSVLARPAPTGTQFGGMTLNPYVNVEFQQDDNVLADADASVASGVILAQPKLLMSGEGSSRKIGFYYTGQYARYMDSPKDDYQDHVFGFEGQQLLGTSAHIDFAADYSQNHENRGSGYSQGLGDSLAQPDLFANTRV
ncbi:MAG: outer membrane beta-barrel protein, partial [Gammaproteobacteria bacterium]|nr:outer membrane beta-barrel protein [Gammaproteobacteria bacterium]